MLLSLGACAALLYALRAARRAFVTVEVAGDSMQPTLEAGEFLIVRRGLPTNPAGRIAYLHTEDGRPLLKRIVRLPGESLRAGDHVEVNGRALSEHYAHGHPPYSGYRAVDRLAEGEFLVLGDNRAASTDSRQFGPVSARSIEGVAWFRYWPPRRFGPLPTPPRRFTAAGDTAQDTPYERIPLHVPLRHGERFGTTS